MWDCHWQDPADYGTRYDYGLIEAHPELINTFNRYNRRQPSEGWLASLLHRPERCKLPPRTVLVDQKPWNTIGKAMGGIGETGQLQFTRGTIATLYAIEHLVVAGGQIVLVGFDNIHRGEALSIEAGFSPAYREQPSTFSFKGYKADVTKHGNHDLAIEGPLMMHMAGLRGIAVTFAQDVW